MTSGQRNVLFALGAAVLLVAAVVVGVSVASGTGRSHVATGTTVDGRTPTSAPGSTDTTLVLLPVTESTVATTQPPATAPTTSGVPATTSTTAPPPAITGAGAVLTAPASTNQRPFPVGSPCSALADPGWSGVRCGVAHATGAVLTWLTETQPGSGDSPATRAYVFGSGSAGTKDVILSASDDAGTRFGGVIVRVDSVAADGGQDIVFGFRSQGSGSILSVDLVHGPGVVAVHQELSQGAARSATGQLDTWAAAFAPGDANCCPSSFAHDTIRLFAGAWRIVAKVSVPPGSVPPSQL